MNITPAILIAALKTYPAYAHLTDMRITDLLQYVMSVEEDDYGGVTINMYSGYEPDTGSWAICITPSQWSKIQGKEND